MHRTAAACYLLLALSPLSRIGVAQEATKNAPPKPQETIRPPEPVVHYYRMDFVVQEVGADGKPTNSRSYRSILSTRDRDRGIEIRAGSRVPIITGSPAEEASKLATQYQYVDVGVNISTFDPHEIGQQLAVFISAEVSNMAAAISPSTANPVIRQNLWRGPVLIPVGKPVVVFASDALENKGGMQLMVTATRLDQQNPDTAR